MRRLSVLIGLAVLPTLLLSAIGILLVIFQRAAFDIVFGILILIFSVAVLTGAFILHDLGRRQLETAKLQTDFVAKVSHELRTPLASIRMFVDTLRQGDLEPDEVQRCLDTLSAETSRLSSMIERLLSWGRMESGRRRYELRPESVATLVALKVKARNGYNGLSLTEDHYLKGIIPEKIGDSRRKTQWIETTSD